MSESKPNNNTIVKDEKYYTNLKQLQVNKTNNIDSGANPFLLRLVDGTYLIHENNTGVGQKYITNPKPETISTTKPENKPFKVELTDSNNNRYVKESEARGKEICDNKMYFMQIPKCVGLIKPCLLQGYQGKYYFVNGEKYDEHFPYEWATNHLSHPVYHMGSGPLNCDNCKKYGTILTVFVGYCMDCHENIYKGERPGIIDAIKTDIETFRILLPYMKDVCFINIGDKKGWTLRKEREQRIREEEERKREYIEYRRSQIHKRNDLIIRKHRKEDILEEEWKDYWGFSPVTKEDLWRFANSEYL
jgi:hypothetical protein